jgi:hypothetical protein
MAIEKGEIITVADILKAIEEINTKIEKYMLLKGGTFTGNVDMGSHTGPVTFSV